ncbi:hypothetical protein JCM30471_15630 [Desulfuromonas carbonis]
MLRLNKSLVFLALFALFGLAASHIHAFDIFWQLQSGKYMVETGSIIRTDLFTLASDAPRYEHCWLHDLVTYAAYRLGGYPALSLLKGLLLGAMALFLVLAARTRSSSWLAILLVLPILFAGMGGWLARPQLWTFCFFALFVWVLERHRRNGGRRILWLIPVVLLWANLHAGVVLAAALWLAYAAGGFANRVVFGKEEKINLKRLFWLAPGLMVAAALTPYPDYLWSTLRGIARLGAHNSAGGQLVGPMTAIFNMDWRPTTFAGEPQFFYALIATALILLVGWRRNRFTDLFLLGGLALMGWRLSRHTTFLYLGMVAILPAYLDVAVRPLADRVSKRTATVLVLCLTLTGAASFAWFAKPPLEKYGWFRLGLRPFQYPVAAVDFLKKESLPKNLYNTYDWGGYLAWQLFPEYLVFWDGRQNSAEMFRYGWEIMAGKPGWEDHLDRFAVNTIVTRTCTMDTGQCFPLLDRLRTSPDWVLVFQDPAALVFVRRNALPTAWVMEHELPPDRIDDTILATGRRLVADNPNRYIAWWEIARIELARRNYAEAFTSLGEYLRRTPVPDPTAEYYYRMLYPTQQGR